MILKYKKIPSKNGKLIENPKYQTEGSACFDLVSNEDYDITLRPNEIVRIHSGIAIELADENFVALVFARSGLSTKHGISLSNSVGVVDSDYRGEIMIGLVNNSNKEYTIKPDERIAQLGITPIIKATLSEVDELSETFRGGNGFGSTGK